MRQENNPWFARSGRNSGKYRNNNITSGKKIQDFTNRRNRVCCMNRSWQLQHIYSL